MSELIFFLYFWEDLEGGLPHNRICFSNVFILFYFQGWCGIYFICRGTLYASHDRWSSDTNTDANDSVRLFGPEVRYSQHICYTCKNYTKRMYIKIYRNHISMVSKHHRSKRNQLYFVVAEKGSERIWIKWCQTTKATGVLVDQLEERFEQLHTNLIGADLR